MNGDRMWYVNGLPCRGNDLPSIEWGDGGSVWYLYGKVHCDGDLPALIGRGVKEWWINGQKHREGGLPAVISNVINVGTCWYVNGDLHRDNDLPAIEWSDGGRDWWFNGQKHRNGGLPSVIRGNGEKEWWINGERVQEPITWTESKEFIDRDDKMCVISLETINPEQAICKCVGGCNIIITFEAMTEWLLKSKSCPHCRREWTHFVKYC